MNKPKIALIYLSYYTKESYYNITECFKSLEKVSYPKDDWCIIVVENPSPYGKSYPFIEKDWKTKAGVTLPRIEIIKNEKDLGYAGANVVGWQAAKRWGADYIYLLNQDTIVDPDFLTEAVRCAEENQNIAVVQSRIMFYDEPNLVNSYGNCLHFLGFGYTRGYKKTQNETQHDPKPIFYPSGAGFLARMSVIELIGLFEPRYYMYHEDADLGWRILLSGKETVLESKSIIFHNYEFKKSITKFYWMERNRLLTHLINFKTATLLLMLPAALFMEMGVLFYSFISGFWRQKLKSYLYFFLPSTWKYIARRRKFISLIRKQKDYQILLRMVGSVESQEVDHLLNRYVATPLTNFYLKILRKVVFW